MWFSEEKVDLVNGEQWKKGECNYGADAER